MQIVLHDYFEAAEGGGRLSLTLAQALHADLGYGFKIRNHPFFEDGLYHGKEFRVSSFTGIPILRQFMLTQAFSRRTKFLQDYNRVIYSGFYSPLAVHNHANGKNIYYCHTPPRFLYDQRDFYLSMIKPWQRPIMHMFNNYLRPRYEASVSKMDTIVANSKNVQARINKYLGHDSVVVHPPCDTESFTWLGQEDYYLSIARLDPLKRVKLVAEAFRDMPDRKLIVVSGGPELEHIKEIAKYTHNITVLGWVHEQELRELLGRCIATIYIPKDEDFGMSPVESMAAGKPVIGVAEGGLLESVIHEETGYLTKADPSIVDIIEAVLTVSPEQAKKLRPACEERAQVFRKKVFLDKMKELF